jgi:hypothetical protein
VGAAAPVRLGLAAAWWAVRRVAGVR